MVLDDCGGFTHSGRRVVLHPDGTFTDTAYTDVRVIGREAGRLPGA